MQGVGQAWLGRLIRGSAGDFLFFLLAEMTRRVSGYCGGEIRCGSVLQVSFYARVIGVNGVNGVNTRGARTYSGEEIRVTVSTEAGELELLYPLQPHVHNENS